MSQRSVEKNAGGHFYIIKGKPLPADSSFVKELKELPDYMNSASLGVEHRLGEFVFENADENSSLIEKGP